MLPPPPRSTLFPYTTLFRSCPLLAAVPCRCSAPGSAVSQPAESLHFGILRRDRKSTRLNSSHRCISYAVFCLKKKKALQTHETKLDPAQNDRTKANTEASRT